VAIGQPAQWIFFRAVTLQGAAVATLPAKMGEAVLPLALVRQANYSLPEAVGVLLLLRLYDFLMIMFIGGIALAALASDFGWAVWRPLLLMGAGATAAAMALFPLLATYVSAQIPKFINPEGNIVRLLNQLSSASRALSARRLAGLILVTALVWISLFLVFYLAGLFVDATPGITASALAGVAGSLAFALPVNGLANLGPFEAAWASVMAPLGILPASAIAAAVLSHFVLIFCNLALAGLGVLHWGGARANDKLI
ncbi:MAG: lysylphosphatidylglycerol synthase domain-containing protein, partial [Alphaproteobacteria bacterium]